MNLVPIGFFIHSKHCIVVVNAYFKLPFEWFAAQSFARFADAVNFYLVTVKFKVIDDMVFNSFTLIEFQVVQFVDLVRTSIWQDNGFWWSRFSIRESDKSSLLRTEVAIIFSLESKQVIFECAGH